MPVDIHLKQRLEELDITYGGDNMFRIFGPTLLSWSTIDSSRAYMFTSHVKQTLSLLNPDVPRLATSFENEIGKYNTSAYKRLNGTWEVKRVIPKFSGIDDPSKQIMTIILYNKDTDTYDMYEKPVAENLTEKFGFVYNTQHFESFQEGDVLTDDILYKSTSYDDNMNYRYGKNARVYYSTSTDTLEDALVIRRGWAETVKSTEIDQIQVPINDNDILLNMYGDDEVYRPFPNVGEEVNDSLLCATRRINKSHLLFDFQPQHLREIGDTDSDYYTSKHSVIYDINVYYNGDDEFPNNIFNKQLRRYYLDCCEYARVISEACNEIKHSGSNYTQNVSYYLQKYKRWNDKNYKWKNQDSVFAHVILEFKVKSIVSLELGAKVTARYGNKGVVSRIVEDHVDFSEQVENKLKSLFGTQNISIVDDERMPYYIHNGKRVYSDIMMNNSGSIRRLNPGQLVEVEVNFIAEQVQFMIQEADTEEEKMRLFFKFLDIVNHDQCTFFKTKIYDEFEHDYTINGNKFRFLATESKKAFIKDIEENGFYIVRPPHKPLLFDDVIRLYEAFPEIKPVDIYVDLFGMDQRKMLRPGVIGFEYLLVLKQNSNKNFSARSTFRVNRSNLPAKDIAKKTNRSSYARTPVRLSEIYNLLASISGEDLAEFNIFTRSSALGRKSLDRILAAPGNPLKVRKLKVQDNYTNANADILAAKLKCMGLRIFFSPNPYGRDMVYDANTVISMHFGNYTIQDIPSKRGFYQDLFTAFDKELKRGEWIQSYKGEKYDICWEEVFKNKELKEKYGDMMTDELKEQLKLCVRGRAAEIEEDINKVVQKRDSSPKSSGTTKRRGRKSKAEMEALRQMQERIVAGEDIAKDLMQAAEDEEIEEEDDSDLIDEE